MPYRMFVLKLICPTLRCLIPVVFFGSSLFSQDLDQARAPVSAYVLRATVILGLDGISNNATGELSIQDHALVFRQSEDCNARIPISSIQDVFISQEDRQVGGTPMALGRAAAPFGGGRVIGLLAHKKYAFLTVEYLDSNGGFHGVIWQMNKGEGQMLGDELETRGVHVSSVNIDTVKRGTESSNEVK
jgi:hypothetical protein